MRVNQNTSTQIAVHLPLSLWEKAMELVSAAGLLIAALIMARSWALLPESIPVRFNLLGEVTAWGGRESIIAIAAGTAVLYLSLTITGRFPQTWKLPWEVIERNAPKLLQISRTMLITLKAIGVCTLGYLQWSMINTALGASQELASWFLPLSLAAVFVTIGICLSLLNKHRQP